MKMQRIETPGIAHYAYVIASGNEAAVIDPARDVEPYLDTVRELGARITHIFETHRQEDFVMGSASLARLTGAPIVNGEFETFGHGDVRLGDGDTIRAGELTFAALHTPGHTPESMCYAIYPTGNGPRAWCVLTGDALLYGTTGRTDLAGAEKARENAALLHDAVHSKLAGLPDTTIVLPAHGPGSVCGNGMAERPWSTIGDEKRYNDVFTLSREDFADRKGGERIPRPPYFRVMEKVNLKGGLDSRTHHDIELLDAETFGGDCSGKLVFDTREPEGFAGGHVTGSHSIWLGGLPVFGGWVGDARTPICLVTDRTEDVETAAGHLACIGIDKVEAALTGGFGAWRKSGLPIGFSGTISPRTLAEEPDRFQVLDVREAGEFEQGHIEGAQHMYVGYLADNLDDLSLDPQRPVVVTCSVGHRAGLGVSILLREGFTDVRNLLGGMTAWQSLGLPCTRTENE